MSISLMRWTPNSVATGSDSSPGSRAHSAASNAAGKTPSAGRAEIPAIRRRRRVFGELARLVFERDFAGDESPAGPRIEQFERASSTVRSVVSSRMCAARRRGSSKPPISFAVGELDILLRDLDVLVETASAELHVVEVEALFGHVVVQVGAVALLDPGVIDGHARGDLLHIEEEPCDVPPLELHLGGAAQFPRRHEGRVADRGVQLRTHLLGGAGRLEGRGRVAKLGEPAPVQGVVVAAGGGERVADPRRHGIRRYRETHVVGGLADQRLIDEALQHDAPG